MQESFLEEKESDFLDHMLKKYELNYLDWAHRTKWLKEQMAEIYIKTRFNDRQIYINFDKQGPTPNVPFEVMLGKTNNNRRHI